MHMSINATSSERPELGICHEPGEVTKKETLESTNQAVCSTYIIDVKIYLNLKFKKHPIVLAIRNLNGRWEL